MPRGQSESSARPYRRPDRIAAAAAVVAIHVLMAVLFGLGMKVALPLPRRDDPLALIVIEPTPPRPEPPPRRPPPEPEAGGAPPARKATPLPKIAPVPVPASPVPPPLIAVAPPVAASGGGGGEDAAGGTGIGGEGGGSGTGEGAGDGADFSEARQIRGRFRNSDFPASARSAGRVRIGVRYAVGPTGRIDHCEISESSGYPEVDAMTCRVIVDRYRFRPARDGEGNPVTEVMEEHYTWTLD